jgi:uncharacterized protein (DUF488 family)
MDKIIYTIGHSNHSLDYFKELLLFYDINCLVDIRSIPASSHTPQFNKVPLNNYLKLHEISYLHFGKEFGARRFDCLDADNNVDFIKAVKTQDFINGVSRIEKGIISGFKIAIMCSEGQPLECHRFAMVARYFDSNGFNVKHILKDKSLVDHKFLQDKMINEYLKKKKIKEIDLMFGLYNEEQQINDAYKMKNKEIAFCAQKENML